MPALSSAGPKLIDDLDGPASADPSRIKRRAQTMYDVLNAIVGLVLFFGVIITWRDSSKKPAAAAAATKKRPVQKRGEAYYEAV
jgi:hypothetical protein